MPNRSTISQLPLSLNDWVLSFNDDVQTDVVYVDFAKAFDMVCQSELLVKLQAYGIVGCLLKWFRSFLIGRKFGVLVGACMSSPCVVRSGLP